MDGLIILDMNSPVHFFKRKWKITAIQCFLLVVLTHTQLWLAVVLEFRPIRAQLMGFRIPN